ncbi:MAG: SBBP repeat-containing protein [Aureispira sp.]
MRIIPLLLFTFLVSSFTQAQSEELLTTQASSLLSQQQAAFEENKGQIWDAQQAPASYVKYHFQKGNINIYLLPTGIAYQFNKVHYPEGYTLEETDKSQAALEQRMALEQQIYTETYRMDMELVGANPTPKIIEIGKSKGYVNYYNRNTLNVHSFDKLIYQEVYPGIDWVIYTTDKGLKYDFVVQPGANPNQIKMRFKHQEDLKINADGSFTLSNSMGSITEQAPVSFQEKKELRSSFHQEGNTISFQLEGYNPKKELIIDPNLVWATYYGGDMNERRGRCETDNLGNVYLTGGAWSLMAIASGGHQNTFGGSIDAFLAKFDANGVRQWATYYGGTDTEFSSSCAVDNNNNVYIAGDVTSNNGVASGGHQNTLGGSYDAFLVKFNAAGVRQWATYYGTSSYDSGNECATDNVGNVYLVGTTSSSSGMASGGYQNTSGGDWDAFLVKFNATGVRQWATYYGGNERDGALSTATDPTGNVYITGSTLSTAGMASGGHQNTYGGGGNPSTGDGDAYLAKFNSAGVRQWATYYGGDSLDGGSECVTDQNGNVYLVGETYSSNNIAFNGHQNNYARSQDIFLVKFDGAGTRQWATYYGGNLGSGMDYGRDCAIDASGNVYLVGGTGSTNNISTRNIFRGSIDAFLAKFNSTGVRQWARYYGGNSSDVAWGCALDGNGYIYVSGQTESTADIASNGHQGTYGGVEDVFLAKFSTTLNCTPTTNTITTSYCGDYTYNGQTYTTSGTYTDTLTNTGGCDSIVTLNLTLGNATYEVQARSYTPINTAGATTVTLGDDALSSALPIGFGFNFFGNIYTDFNISSNGFISFGANTSNGCCSGQVLPNVSQPNNVIALAWEDLIPPNGGQISYLTVGTAPNRILVVEFSGIEHYPSGDSVQGQIHLYEGLNIVEVHLGSQPQVGRHTLGIENSTGTLGYTPPNRNGVNWSITTPEAWRFLPIISGFDVQTACNSYTWIDGNTYTANNIRATHIIEGGASTGCDSTVRLNLTIYDAPGGNGQLTEDMEGGALFAGTGYTYDLTNASIYNPDNIPVSRFSVLDGPSYGYGMSGGFANSNRSVRFSTYDIAAGNEMAVIMKKVDLALDSEVDFSYAYQTYPNAADTMQVEVSSDCGVTWSTVWRKSGGTLETAGSNTARFLPPFTANDWRKDTADLSAYDNTADVLVKFTVISGFGNNLYLDDININSTPCNNTIGNLTVIACNSYTTPSGKYTYTTDGFYSDTIVNSCGADSIIRINLTINNATTGTDVQTACGSYTWINGVTYTSSNNTATYRLINSVFCDSIVTLDLTINNATTGVDVQTACNAYTWINGTTYTSSNNSATVTLTNASGCDSVVRLDLTINNATTGVDVQTACDAYTWIDGNTYINSNNSATVTLTNVSGCDSIVTLDLTINTVDIATTVNGNIITANAIGASYQWLDCINGNTPVIGATGVSLTPPANGDYAVEVTQNGCVDTSACVNVTVIAIEGIEGGSAAIAVYPNPTTGNFSLDLGEVEGAMLYVFAANGQLVQQQQLLGQGIHPLELEGAAGVYFLQIQIGDQIQYRKLIKK